ncbi:MAG: bifunctional DNA-formamidopyrimidine glycosylase/DNA-(apurinic or apyrimidinic site) lyase [Candidatus Eremiobacteraeota bacterium]|nr:bifunctional DNA-formamidopyrimidine glycosylase/DNA-(apurinic or apyrimidinic site) lyase [Candidatus Eremiobacteraeota bacterium]MBV8372170.1 bifunctional DNA-formamidopyrimidine glycosylase/DNA-(apurinic or apyrimidinic site) lyase [Candidatus Eremiobacteraeota bacterium]
MPELPEVETIVRGLAGTIVGKEIARVDVRLARIAVAPDGVRFDRALAGDGIAGTRRRGKYAIIDLRSGRSLVTGLRMTGRLVVQRPRERNFAGTHIVLRFTDGTRLSFADVRTFGRMRLVEAGDPWDDALGIEPLSPDFTPQAFLSMLAGRTTPIKALLLDQRRIAGIGNIYACEALWEARIRPSLSAGALTKPAVRRLHHAIVDVLHRAIALRGTSVDDYVDAGGLRGGFQNALSVYGRLGEPCIRCGGRIVRTVLGQRGTWWCRRCQR